MEAEDWLECCARKTTEALFEDMRQLHSVESEMIAPILAHLSELDVRDAVLPEAYPSLFVYCIRELAYSEAEAFLRIRAARAARRFPRILGMLARRELHVSAVARLAPHLTSENYRRLLDRASRRTISELQTLVAELAPEPEKRPVIRTLSVGLPAPLPEASKEDLFSVRPERDDPAAEQLGAAAAAPCAASGADDDPPAVLVSPPAPEAETRVLFNFVGSGTLREKFKRAQGLLRHKYPYGEPALIIEDALDALLDRKDPERRIARNLKRANAKRRPAVLGLA